MIKFHIKRLGAAIASTLGLTYSVEPGVMNEYETGLGKIAEAKGALRQAKAQKVATVAACDKYQRDERQVLFSKQRTERSELVATLDAAIQHQKVVLVHDKQEAAQRLLETYNLAYPRPVVKIKAPAAAMPARDVTPPQVVPEIAPRVQAQQHQVAPTPAAKKKAAASRRKAAPLSKALVDLLSPDAKGAATPATA